MLGDAITKTVETVSVLNQTVSPKLKLGENERG